MKTRTRTILSAAALATAGLLGAAFAVPAAADMSLAENQAITVNVEGRTAVVYFSTADNAFTVVATAADDAGAAAPLRTVHTLNDGEGITLQLSGTGADQALTLVRADDRLLVQAPAKIAGL